MILFCTIHILTSRQVTLPGEKGKLLQHLNQAHSPPTPHDEERGKVSEGSSPENVHSDSTIKMMRTPGANIQWRDISYTVPVGRHKKKILDNINGFVEPGTLTALMGATGAGKTTLLDVLSNRKNVGVITGSILVNGNSPDDTYQRRTGYAQKADYHLPTTTVKEALRFSAEIRQHRTIPKSEKLKHADDILSLVGLDFLSDAIVESLSVEQRKRLTIGIELAAKPDLLSFLDEPTSGLDSQTAFTICDLLVKIARAGHTIMCTIHQPSAAILDMFDRLLLIEKGGRTVYFGDIGTKASKMIGYFESRGARACETSENPAEWMLDITGATSQARNTIDWHEAWLASTNYHQLVHKLSNVESLTSEASCSTDSTKGEFAISFASQLHLVLRRTMNEYWRTPEPLYARFLFYCGAAIAIGASCYQSSPIPSIQGLQNLVFSLFLLFTTFSNVMQKIIPQFSGRRALLEAREQPSKTFSWQAFMVSSVLIEAFWQTLLSVMSFLIMYYLTGFQLYTSSSDETERGGLMLLIFISFFLFTSSLSHVLIAGIEEDEAAVNIGQLLFYLMLIFCGAIKTKDELPRFWIFMYRVSPLTYMLRSMFAIGVVNRPVDCSASEVVLLPANPGMSCGEYLDPYVSVAGGRVNIPGSKGICQYCPLATTDEFLTILNMKYGEVGRDIGIIFGFITFNIAACLFIYWLARVSKRRKSLFLE
jgi:ATP-binding cassette subfamily G (WHITE) protein 2 (PDR)